MNWNVISALATAIASLIALVGLIFIYIQIRYIERQISGSASATLYGHMIDIDRFFAENSQLKAFIYGGKPINAGDPEYDKLRSIAEMMVDLMEHLLVQRRNLPVDAYRGWLTYVTYLYDSSPIIREHIRLSGTWYVDILEAIGRTGPCPPIAHPGRREITGTGE